jgi:predicted amidophosphoribosyltransferase
VLPTVRSALLDAVALVAPVACAGCGAPDRAICTGCAALLRPRVARHELEGVPVYTALTYEAETRGVLLALKEDGRPSLARALGPALAAAVEAALAGCSDGTSAGTSVARIVPVPSSPAAFRRRGYDPVVELMRGARFRPTPLLALTSGAVQKSLGVDARRSNRTGAMRARRAPGEGPLLVVDDVVTTGATLLEAVRALSAAGGTVVACVALARTPLRSAAAASVRQLRTPRPSPEYP